MKIAILGANGLLGEACMRVFALKTGVEAIGITREDLDLKDQSAVKEYMESQDYDVCIYAAAISGLEDCLENPIDAMKVNALAPEIISSISHEKGAKMVYISTDYVLDGEKECRPDEDAIAAPINAYGKTKREGELRVMEKSPDALVCRVSWLFGRGRSTFVDQVVHADREASYIGDKFSVPNYCDDLAQALVELLDRKDGKNASGVLHLVNSAEPESWYSFAKEVVYSANHLGLTKSYSQSILSTDLADAHFFKEARPRHTAMISKRLENEFGVEIMNWKQGLEEYLLWKRDHDLTND